MKAEERRELVRGFDDVLADVLSVEKVLSWSRTGELPDDLRRTLAELGWFDLGLSPESDGLGLSAEDLVALCVVAGYRLLPTPLRDEALVLGPLLERAGAPELQALRQGAIAGGGVVLAPGAVDRPGSVVMSLSPGASLGFVLGPESGRLVGLDDHEVRVLPGTDLTSGQARVSDPQGADVPATFDLWRTWVLCVLADCLGAAQAALDLSVAYAQDRVQFGKPIASFQGVSHRLADMKRDIELCASGLARVVALQPTNGAVDDLLLSMVHAIPARTRAVCEGAIQVHGGMGFTWEAGIHLFYRRVLQAQAALGGAVESARMVGRRLAEKVSSPGR